MKQIKEKLKVIPNLKLIQYTLDKEIFDEKLKIKALAEELGNTINVHRWRRLESTENELYEQIMKVSSL